ncbi:MAG: pyrophosphatase PpaX [Firmicutes bacterium]|nr:pyrophosphatase PpaX [Bacillota bacterium]MCL5039816.1 pyrophosphatase PpaX [Bacillota bacterium]
MLKAVLFDLDGTLLDTRELILESFRYAYRLHLKREVTTEEIMAFWGQPLMAQFQQVAPEKADFLREAYQDFNIKNHQRLVTLFPGVQEVLDALRQRPIPMAIVTSKARRTVCHGLQLFGLKDYFQTLVTTDDIIHPKPHPEPVQVALQRLGIKAAESLMVGDNDTDVLAGKAAGTQTAAALWGAWKKEALLAAGADYHLESVVDLLKLLE